MADLVNDDRSRLEGVPGIDLAGVPRLDLSQHGSGRRPDLRFIERLDPGLKRVLEGPQ